MNKSIEISRRPEMKIYIYIYIRKHQTDKRTDKHFVLESLLKICHTLRLLFPFIFIVFVSLHFTQRKQVFLSPTSHTYYMYMLRLYPIFERKTQKNNNATTEAAGWRCQNRSFYPLCEARWTCAFVNRKKEVAVGTSRRVRFSR